VVVLNQILLELAHSSSEPSAGALPPPLMHRLSRLVWLDGGHNGGPATNAWVTDRHVLSHVASLKELRLHVRVTPYQVIICVSTIHQSNHCVYLFSGKSRSIVFC
jgi:Uncharacterised protein family UPF0565